MRMLLINPPQPYMIEKHTQAPLGILYLSAIIKRERTIKELTVLDLSADSIENSILKIKSMSPFHVCGFTATTLDYCLVLEMMKELRKSFKNTLFIIGGPHATPCALEVIQDGWDSVFKGESDLSILEFIDDISKKKRRWESIYESKIVEDLNWLPYPDRDAISWLGGKVLTREHKSSINIMASRACSRKCTFCSSKSMWGKNVRWRSPESVVDEIRYCIDKYNIRIFRFSDDNMISNARWTKDFCRLVKPLKIIWRMSVRIDEAKIEILQLLRDAGCVELGFGVESFDRNVLKILNKQITPEQSIQAINNAYEVGIGIRILMMISTPGETYKSTVDQNIAGLESMKKKFVYLSIKPLVPFPGSDIFNYPERFGVSIKTKDFSRYNMWMYSLDEKGNKAYTEESILRIHSMTEEQQKENLIRMREYTETLPETQRG